jgi:hypothetical protein
MKVMETIPSGIAWKKYAGGEIKGDHWVLRVKLLALYPLGREGGVSPKTNSLASAIISVLHQPTFAFYSTDE